MYSELWSTRLRQGDIVGPVPLPILGKTQQVISSVTSFGGNSEPSVVESMVVPAKARYAAILSHDCEFNEAKREHILLARIQRVDPRLSPEAIEQIRLSNDVRGRHDADQEVDGVDNFLIDEIEGHLAGPHVVAFTTMIPYPATPAMLDALYKAKRAEMLHDQRLLLKQKLAWFFIRSNDDLPEPEKRPRDDIIAEREA